jgi:hypothetical protein
MFPKNKIKGNSIFCTNWGISNMPNSDLYLVSKNAASYIAGRPLFSLVDLKS